MINIIDLIIGGFILFYLLKNAGGLTKTIKNIIVILLLLIVYGIVAELILGWPFAERAHKPLKDSYLRKVSHLIIRWVYPAVEKSAPRVDTFIKKEILSKPAPQVVAPKVELPEKALPKLTLPEMPKLK